MASNTQTSQTKTTGHEELRRWVEEHGGRPARVRGSYREEDDEEGEEETDAEGAV